MRKSHCRERGLLLLAENLKDAGRGRGIRHPRGDGPIPQQRAVLVGAPVALECSRRSSCTNGEVGREHILRGDEELLSHPQVIEIHALIGFHDQPRRHAQFGGDVSDRVSPAWTV